MKDMRKRSDPDPQRRRQVPQPVFEVRVGDRFVRWVGATLARRLCQDRRNVGRVIPGRPCGFSSEFAEAQSRQVPAHSIFSEDFIVLARVAGPRLPITSGAGLARQLRRALMSFADQPVAEVISGHQSDGAPAATPHLAVVPLPAVIDPAPDGVLLGVGLVLPRNLKREARSAVARALSRFEDRCRPSNGEKPSIRILLGATGELVLQRDVRAADCHDALRPATWIGPARWWTSITPIALDRNPGDLHHTDPVRRQTAQDTARACVIEAVRRIGLPVPLDVMVFRSCAVPGVADSKQYPRFPAVLSRHQRVLVHAHVRFDEPVSGPVLIGAGRYQGLGLLLPFDERQPSP